MTSPYTLLTTFFHPLRYAVVAAIFITYTFMQRTLELTDIVGAFIALIGFSGWIISRRQLGLSFSVKPQAKPLITTGVYSKLRHPIYVFSLIAWIGLCLIIQHYMAWAILIAIAGLQLFRVRKEEAILTKEFGAEYLKYKQQTWI